MFSPALVKYIVDPENTLEHREENTTTPIEKHFCKLSMVCLNKVRADCGFFSAIFAKIKSVFVSNKKLELYERD